MRSRLLLEVGEGISMSLDRYLDRLTVGDRRELARVIPDESIDLIFTDPPYLKANIEDGIYA